MQILLDFKTIIKNQYPLMAISIILWFNLEAARLPIIIYQIFRIILRRILH